MQESIRRAVNDNLDLREAILNGFDNANRSLRELSPGSATTMAVVQIENRTMRPYHAGDCAILVVGQRGRIRLETVAHSPVGYAVHAGLLAAEEAMHHEERHLVSNMVGCDEMRIEVGAAIELKPTDTVVLATDGLTDNLHIEEIAELVRKGPLQKAAESLCRLGVERMTQAGAGTPSKPDDLSFIVFRPASPGA
jgi:serine/threonine protein phosphatase PrpC